MFKKGDKWNESQTHSDAVTRRTVRRITTAGEINYKAPYHTRTTFTEDGRFMIFGTVRDGQNALCRAEVETGEITALTEPVDSDNLSVNPGTIAPKSGWVVYWHGRSLRAVNIHSLDERTLIENIGREWKGSLMSVDPSETYVVTAVGPENPDVVAGKSAEEARDYKEIFRDGKGMLSRLVQVPLAGGAAEVVFNDEEGVRLCHVEHNPADGDLFYLDRDLPPMFHCGGDYSKTSRCWALRLSTGELTALTPDAEAKFQVHAAWSWDGECPSGTVLSSWSS